MELTSLPRITARLVMEGRPADTPVAAIENGTTPGQRVVTGVLSDIDVRVREAGLCPPALIAVGEVVSLRDELSWYEPDGT